jgi:hypothetical protein
MTLAGSPPRRTQPPSRETEPAKPAMKTPRIRKPVQTDSQSSVRQSADHLVPLLASMSIPRGANRFPGAVRSQQETPPVAPG